MLRYTASEESFSEWAEEQAGRDVAAALNAGDVVFAASRPPILSVFTDRKAKLMLFAAFPRISDREIGEALRHAARLAPTHVAWVAPFLPAGAQEAVRYLNEMNLGESKADTRGVIFAAFQAVERGGEMHLHRATSTASEEII